MNERRWIKIFLILLIITTNIGCDQVSKKIVRKNVAPYESIRVFDKHITITNVENTGAFLSLGSSFPRTVKNILLSLLPLVAIVFGVQYLITRPSLPGPTLTGFSFVIGGGIGNLFDRIAYGSVTDFLHIDLGFFQSGIFNMADLSIMTGVLIIFYQIILRKKN